MSAALVFTAFAGAVGGAYLTLGILRVGDFVLERRERLERERQLADENRRAMARALRAILAEGGTGDFHAYRAAIDSLQACGDDLAAQFAYVMFAAECEREGNTWTAVEEAA